jgi:hypothetical protein
MSRLVCRTAVVETPFLNLAEHPERTLAALVVRCRHLEETRPQIVGRTRVLRERVATVAVRLRGAEGCERHVSKIDVFAQTRPRSCSIS